MNRVSRRAHPSSTTDLFVLVSSDGDELRFGERLAADHLLDASHLHDVYPRLVFVQRIQHDLWEDSNQWHHLAFIINSRTLRSSKDGAVK